MAEDPKSKSSDKDGDEKPKKSYSGESDESVTKIERPRKTDSGAPETKAAEGDDDGEKPAKKPSEPGQKSKTVEVEGEPTGAQTPVALKATEKSDKPDAKAAKKVVEKVVEDDDEPPVRRPGKDAKPAAKKPAAGSSAAATSATSRSIEEGVGRRRRASAESGGLILLFAGFLVLGNLALKSFTAGRYDSTREERFSLSKKGTGHLLETLKKPLAITVYAPEGLATVDNFVRDLRDLLSEYVRYGNGKVSYEIIYPDKLEGEQRTKAEAAAAEAGLHKQILGEGKAVGGKQATIGEGYLGMVMTYGGEREKLDQGDGFSERNTQGLEFMISSKIRELRDKEDKISHKVGYLQGHKEHGFQELSQIFGKYFPYYKLEAVDLSKGEKEVDPTLDGLFVTQPEEEIPEKELRRINQFLMKGKAVAVFANPLHVKENDVSMNSSFSGMGIDKLLSGYGVDFKSELVIDRQHVWTPVFQLPNGLGVQLDPYYFIYTADAKTGPDSPFDNAFAPFFRQQGLAVPFPLEMTVDKVRAGGDQVKIKTIIKSSPNLVTLQGTAISMNPSHNAQGATGQKESNRKKGEEAIFGLDLEGPIKSAFPTAADGIDAPVTATGNARLMIVSSGLFFGNAFQESGKSPFGQMMPGMDPNMGADEELMRYAQIYQRDQRGFLSGILIAWHTCDWMTGETDLLAVGAKFFGDAELSYEGIPAPVPAADEKPDSDSYKKKKSQYLDQIKSTQRMTTYACTIGSPFLLLAFGLVRAYRRNVARANQKI